MWKPIGSLSNVKKQILNLDKLLKDPLTILFPHELVMT